MTPAGTSIDIQNEWEENTHTQNTHSRRENNSEGVQRGAVAKAHGAGRGEGGGGGGDEVGDEASREPDDDVMEGAEKGDVVPVVPGSESISVADRLLGVSLYGRMSGVSFKLGGGA